MRQRFMEKKITPRFPDYDWYCVHCHELLNTQLGFNDNKFTWKCTNCSYRNSISKDNLRKPYAYLKNPSAANTFFDFIKGIIRSVYSLISRTALYCMIAFFVVLGTKMTTFDYLSLGLVNPLYKEDYFCAALYCSSIVFLITLIVYAVFKRFVGRPDSKKHFIRETVFFLRDNCLYPFKNVKSLFSKTTITDKIISVISILGFLLTLCVLVYGCRFWI